MGTKTAVFFANIFMAYIEKTPLSETVFKPTVWKCYIDYIFPHETYVKRLLDREKPTNFDIDPLNS